MTTVESTGPDRQALRERYLAERDKRLRPDGPDQYVEMTGRYGHFIEDPYVEMAPREPRTDEVTVVLVGGGFAGLVTAAPRAGGDHRRPHRREGRRLRRHVVLEPVPGAQCDVESYIYLPLLEETGYVPKEKYSPRRRSRSTADASPTTSASTTTCLSTEVTGMEWDDATSRWIIRTNRGDAMRAQYVVIGGGTAPPPQAAGHPWHRGLRRPQLPHQPVGLRLHRRRHPRWARWAARQARRHHRHRGHGRAGGAPPRRGMRAALRVPADAVVDRRARQPPHRSRVGRRAGARLADRAHRQLHGAHGRWVRRRGPRDGRVDRHHRTDRHDAPAVR